jgi:hypothetical protein
VTERAQELLLPLSRLDNSEELWRDTLTDRYVRAEDGVLRVPLDAYEVVWLESAGA